MHKKSWIAGIKAKRRAMTLRATAYIVGLVALWLLLTSAGLWAWVHVFHRAPPGRLMLELFTAIGAVVITPLCALAPLAPMKGKDPQIMAAEEYFKGPDAP